VSKDGTNRGGARPGAGRKPKAVAEKIASGNPGGRPLTVVDFSKEAANLTGSVMPPVKDYLKAKQKDGSVTCAEDIFKETWQWLRERKCEHLVTTQQIEQYAMSVARWIQCEEAISEYGFLAKKASGTVIASPYVTMGKEYMKPSNAAWYQIFQIVKENCTVDIGGPSPMDDVMERLLRARGG
jgi:hypothetical protein